MASNGRMIVNDKFEHMLDAVVRRVQRKLSEISVKTASSGLRSEPDCIIRYATCFTSSINLTLW
jgi:hypothetical protein